VVDSYCPCSSFILCSQRFYCCEDNIHKRKIRSKLGFWTMTWTGFLELSNDPSKKLLLPLTRRRFLAPFFCWLCSTERFCFAIHFILLTGVRHSYVLLGASLTFPLLSVSSLFLARIIRFSISYCLRSPLRIAVLPHIAGCRSSSLEWEVRACLTFNHGEKEPRISASYRTTA